MRRLPVSLSLPPVLALLLGACGGASAPVSVAGEAGKAATPRVDAAPAASPSPSPVAAARLPTLHVHKTPGCGCCEVWGERMREAGFAVEMVEAPDLEAIRKRLGVPFAKGSCHTAEVDGYVIEGHVPAEDIKRLLDEHPDARGLTVPGMPLGSPGMEAPDGTRQPYTVELIERDGSTREFASH